MRSTLIDLMCQYDQLSLRDASNLLQINYESAKAIWSVFKSEGRRFSLKKQKYNSEQSLPSLREPRCSPPGLLSSSILSLLQFERASEKLKSQATELCSVGLDTGGHHFLAFRAKLLTIQKRQSKFQK